LLAHLAALRDRFAGLEVFTKDALEAGLRAVAVSVGDSSGTHDAVIRFANIEL